MRARDTPLRFEVDFMCFACEHVIHMPTMIQIRNVPDAVHRRLKAQAAIAGQSLSSYLLGEMKRLSERPTLDELRDRLAARSSVTPPAPLADMVREERDGR